MNYLNKSFRLVKRPEGMINGSEFELGEERVSPIADGEVLVETKYVSVDPTNRIWMSDVDQYMPPVGLGEVMRADDPSTVMRAFVKAWTEAAG